MLNIDFQELKYHSVHFPVLIREVLHNLQLPSMSDNVKNYLDCTFGAGGYSSFILKNPKTNIIAIDRDNSVRKFADCLAQQYKDRFSFFHDKFSNYNSIIDKLDMKLNGIVMDLGFSSMQVTDAKRGFSFKREGELLMSMGLNNITANEVINSYSEKLLADIIYYYGDEVKAKQIARYITQERKKKPIETTEQLANIVRNVVKFRGRTDPATKTFQAIRIYVNDELGELTKALNNSLKYLEDQGRLLVISFHSLEDKIVKDFFKQHSSVVKYKNKYKEQDNTEKRSYKIITKKPIIPTKEEIIINPPSSSAKLRVAEKISH